MATVPRTVRFNCSESGQLPKPGVDHYYLHHICVGTLEGSAWAASFCIGPERGEDTR
ncbi:Uncharacterised protein [Rhodococcus gordoniae]|uniref:Uncharacterized protein n=1 Tax=Rhodococcus gordoniae TaxID=223392 RepID=A0A379PMB3_9NOCA|nr:Uncharacterised protein [Rhodococcus gordoniae]